MRTNGTLVGIVNSRLDDLVALKKNGAIPQNANFAIKSDVVRTFLGSSGVRYKTASRSLSDIRFTPESGHR
jgi:hypothetical protein